MTHSWTFLAPHGHVLLSIARNPDARLRDIAAEVGLTERSIIAIVGDLVAAGYVSRRRVGRRNHYDVHADRPLRHSQQEGVDTKALLELLGRH